MGIEPLEPGCRRLRVRPQLGSLSRATIELPTVRGAVKLKCSASPELFTADLDLPANTSAQLYLPRLNTAADRVREGGNIVPARVEGKFLVVDHVSSGRHLFIVEHNPDR
jgi:hypothetical protein